MKDAFELSSPSHPVGPSPRGSLHAAVSQELSAPSVPQFLPERAPAPLPPLRQPLKPKPLVSFVVSTFNRRDVLLRTVAEIDRCGLKSEEYEVIVVDNASTDGTSDALRQAYPLIHLMHQEYNAG